MEKKQVVFLSLLAFTLVGAGWLAGNAFATKPPREATRPLRDISRELQLVEPLLAVGDFELLRDFDSLKRTLEQDISKYKTEKSVKRVSVYYRDLESGRWMGIDENELYAPASMYKVALMITLLKAAQTNPQLLNTQLVFRGSPNILGEAEPVPRLRVGESYSVSELLNYLIVYSDNDAKNLLHTIVSPKAEREVFTDLGLTPPASNDTGDSLSAKEYSIFFRILFNGTYIWPTFSERALKLLSQPEFTAGLVAGVPKEVTTAHKFGRRVFDATKTTPVKEELHDCGNIYLKDRPYFLCVMTEGWSDIVLSGIISDISKTVYDYTVREYR